MTNLAQLLSGAAGGAIAASGGVLAYAARIPSCTLFAPSVHRGATTRRAIALTFDDGPSESTPELLEILAACRAPATFFQCGASVLRLPQVTREVASAGHEIGNHSHTHSKLYFKSPGFIADQLAAAQEAIQSVTGVRPRYFRAPYGVRWFGLRQAQRRLGLMGVMWTTIARDWKLPAPAIVARLLQGACNGAIFCLHDGRPFQPRPNVDPMLQAVRELLPILMDQGFHFEKVTDILCPTKN
jgi:peptidoglycan/xylan/chitin deacetylase (PgdA/CDA1 family)